MKILFFLPFFFANASLAEKATFCRPAKTIFAKVSYCEQNKLYLTQATECEAALKKKVSSASTSLQAMLLSKKSAEAQAAKFSQSGQDYGVTKAQLDILAVQAGVAAADVLAYQDFVVQPEDTDNPDIAGSNPQKYADGVPCYGDTRKGLKDASARLLAIQNQLKAASLASANFEKAAGAAAAGVGAGAAGSSTVPASSGPANSSLRPLKGLAQPKGASDISGTKEQKTNK